MSTSTTQPYSLVRAADVIDYAKDGPGAFRAYGRSLESAQIGLNVRVLEPGQASVPPGKDASWGHSHTRIEEIYYVTRGLVTVRLDDEVMTLGAGDAVRVSVGVVRGMRNDSSEPAEIIMTSQRVEDPMTEAVMHDGFWDDSN